ncbi:MAG: undecaprenyl/decaprenyl-phosphate alpha-N-acetylglucosaminyl 1-phosphate transferase [Alphaproteobacteria bacterium]|nr:undecaprenyl/decaprenyl-phosphate alpha-N-acetylglucosaminyl 1-phosphate transferase [Alphaproteobacteria bacterium]
MTDGLWLLTTCLVSFAGAVALCRAVMAVGVRDAPDEPRKTQLTAVPTLGGVGVCLASAIALMIAYVLGGQVLSKGVMIVLGASVGALLIGLIDDVRGLGARLKLGLLIGVGIWIAALGVGPDVLSPWPGAQFPLPMFFAALGALAWIILMMNAVNFMDGANGLSMGMAAIAAAGLCACAIVAGASDIALCAGALCGALVGFLVWNVPGRLFAGDAGALMTGGLLAGLSLLLVERRPDWLCLAPTLMLPFLTDVILTLGWRLLNGKNLLSAHRDHAYQIAIKAGLSHWQVSAVHAVWALNAAGLSLVAGIAGGWFPLMAFLTLAGASIWVHIRVRASGVRAGLVGRGLA